MSISKVNGMQMCKEVRCCCIYDNQTLKMSIFCSYYLHWITPRLCSVRHPSGAGCSKCFTFCTFEIWEIWHFCVKVSNTTTNFVVKRCKYKYWIAFCRCSRAIWIASERKANFHEPLTRCIQFAFLSDPIHMAREHRQNAIQCLKLTWKVINHCKRQPYFTLRTYY